MKYALPEGWTNAPIESLVSHSIGGVWGSAEGLEEVDVKVLRVTEFGKWGRLHPETSVVRSVSRKQLSSRALQPGDLLLEKSGGGPTQPVGRVAHFDKPLERPAIPTNFVQLLRPDLAKVHPKYLLYVMAWNHARGEVEKFQRATTNIRNLQTKSYLKSEVPLPSLEDQGTIVDVIEEQFSRLDAGVESLQRAKRNLARLGAAFFNQLNGENWPKASLASLTTSLRYGTSTKCSYSGVGPPVLRIPNVRNSRVDTNDLKRAVDRDVDLSRTTVQTGDVLFIRTNGSRDLIGRTALVGGRADGMAFASYLIRARPTPSVRSEYLQITLSSPQLRKEITSRAVTSAGQYNVSARALESLEIPLPPIDAQLRIIAEFDRQSSIIGSIGQTINTQAARVVSLRNSILARSFPGGI